MVKAPYGQEFCELQYFDRKRIPEQITVECGDFRESDTDLQLVERDKSSMRTPEFTDNWMHVSGRAPFVMDIECTALLIVEKDSGSPAAGVAEVYADGKLVRVIDPHEVGWVHCNALICFRGQERKRHHVEVVMKPGEEEKQFTILGFGYVM